MSEERDGLRDVFFETWHKYLNKLPLEDLEAQLIDIILAHPEYHGILNDPETFKQHDFPEENPFFHMSLHQAIREQISTDRPPGMKILHQHLLSRFQDPVSVEHRMMNCLAEILWEAQTKNAIPDENTYLEKLRRL